MNAKELETVIKKAEQWDKLEAKIAKFYPEEEEEYVDEELNLCDIGEICAMAFGYL